MGVDHGDIKRYRCSLSSRALVQAFLKAHVQIVDPGVTASLLASYGRLDDLMLFASYRQVLALGLLNDATALPCCLTVRSRHLATPSLHASAPACTARHATSIPSRHPPAVTT